MTRPLPSAAPLAPLGLQALDSEDLALISAHMQDALIRVGDLTFLPQQRRFALIAARCDRRAESEGRQERCQSGLHFDSETRVRRQQIDQQRPEGVLALLAITFETAGKEAPSGVIRLIFAGGPEIQLEVECVEAQMRDIGPRWSVAAQPNHDLTDGLDEDAGGGS